MKLKYPQDEQSIKLLKSRGIPNFKKSFNIKGSIGVIAYEDNTISINTQLNWLKSIIDKTPNIPFIYTISTDHNTIKAKAIAGLIALAYFSKGMKKSIENKGLPLWHNVYGGYKDPLRDENTINNINLLIVDNIAKNSTDVKLEKARDLLEKYDNIPRIVIATGLDPFSLIREKLYVDSRRMLYLHSNTKTINI